MYVVVILKRNARQCGWREEMSAEMVDQKERKKGRPYSGKENR